MLFAAFGVSLLAIPAIFVLPWQVWTNSEIQISGYNTAGVAAWELLSVSNIPQIAGVIGVVAIVAAFRRRIGWIHPTAGLLIVLGGLWIGVITGLDVGSMPNNATVHSAAGSGVYLASAMAATLVLLGIVVVAKAKSGFAGLAVRQPTINHQSSAPPSGPQSAGRTADETATPPAAARTSEIPSSESDQTAASRTEKPESYQDLSGITFAPTAIIWGLLIGLGAGAASENFVVGVIVAIVVSAVGWYLIQLFEHALVRALLAGMGSLAKWIEARNPNDAQMKAIRDRTSRFLRSYGPGPASGPGAGHPAAAPQPGWYQDPTGAPGERYWNGQSWGSECRPDTSV